MKPVAPTGIAAVPISEIAVHSLFKLNKSGNEKRRVSDKDRLELS